MNAQYISEMVKQNAINRTFRKSRNRYLNKGKLEKKLSSKKTYAFKKLSLAELRQRKLNRTVKFAAERKLRWLKTGLALVVSGLILKGALYAFFIIF